MSKINELINELCPDGVKFLFLGEICEIKTGKGITKKDSIEGGEFPIISGGKEPMGMYHLTNRQANTVTISRVGANAGFVNFIDVDFYLNDKCFSVIPIEKYKNAIDSKFLYEYLKNNEQKITDMQSEGGVPTINTQKVSSIAVPVPPLEVQREIVHILDSFTSLTAELTAELTTRKKQYEFYRNKLLSHDGIYPMKPLAELGKWSGGKTPSMSEKSFWEQGTIPWISSKDMKSSTLEDTQDHITEKAIKEASMTVYPANSIAVVTRSGILKHTFPVAYVPFETTINQDIKMLVVNEDILPRYAFYIIQGKGKDILVKTKKQGGTVDSLDFQKVLAYKVPVPPKDIQSKVVEVLDNFEAICTDLNIGLPAEIEARQKQYEYYRDLLLTFVETNGNLLTDRQTDRQI